MTPTLTPSPAPATGGADGADDAVDDGDSCSGGPASGPRAGPACWRCAGWTIWSPGRSWSGSCTASCARGWPICEPAELTEPTEPTERPTAAIPTPRRAGRPTGHAHAGESGPVDSRAARERLSLIAGLAQLAGWVTADVGAPTSALSAFRLGLRAADRGGDRPLAGHLLGCLAQLTAEDGDPRAALRLARSAQRRAGATASSGVRSLLALRLAYGAAVAGARRDCEEAIAAAERAAQQRDPALDPDWLYWFDEAHFAATVGRCYVALGRSGPARPLLESALAAGSVRFRAAAITGASLARAHLDAGDLDAACGAATDALLTCVQSGSVRAAGAVLALDRRLRATAGPGGRPAAMRDYLELISSARPFLAAAGDRPARPARPASATPTGRSTTPPAARSGTPRAGPAPERGDPRSDDLRHRRPSTVQDARQEPRSAGGS